MWFIFFGAYQGLRLDRRIDSILSFLPMRCTGVATASRIAYSEMNELIVCDFLIINIMKKTFLFFIVVLLFSSCAKQWEYKTLSVEGTMENEFQPSAVFDVTDADLNILGKQGWELVEVYTQTGTVYCNFGDDRYITGIRENVQTFKINFVFKREFKQ